ncbi:unnamed protein product [Lampetra planeri]
MGRLEGADGGEEAPATTPEPGAPVTVPKEGSGTVQEESPDGGAGTPHPLEGAGVPLPEAPDGGVRGGPGAGRDGRISRCGHPRCPGDARSSREGGGWSPSRATGADGTIPSAG